MRTFCRRCYSASGNCRRGLAERGIRPGSTDKHLIGVVGTGLVATARCIRMQQIRRHALSFFRDAEVALEGKFHAAGRADARGNSFIARIQNVAIVATY